MLKKENGITIVTLIITIVVMLILAGAIMATSNIVEEANRQRVATSMIMIQTKVKVIKEKADFSGDSSYYRYTLFLCRNSLFFLNGTAQGQVSHGSCDEERAEGTEDDTENHGESETADTYTTEDEDTQQHNQCGNRGVDGTCQCLVQ